MYGDNLFYSRYICMHKLSAVGMNPVQFQIVSFCLYEA